ncbi:hypothetical protein LA080_003402 [Diaporthe eres]|nr:hypothetical protein LA080_003402 [Diaporthe eres]
MQPKPPCCMFQLSMPPMGTRDRLSTCHETPGIGEGLRSGSCRYAFAIQELLSSSSPHARMLTNGSPGGYKHGAVKPQRGNCFCFTPGRRQKANGSVLSTSAISSSGNRSTAVDYVFLFATVAAGGRP